MLLTATCTACRRDNFEAVLSYNEKAVYRQRMVSNLISTSHNGKTTTLQFLQILGTQAHLVHVVLDGVSMAM